MKRITITLALEIMAVLWVGMAAKAADMDQAVRTQILQTFQLDPTSYEVEVLSSQLRTTQLDGHQDISIKQLSEKQPLGLFSVIVTVMQDGKPLESGQVSLNIRKFVRVLVTQDNLTRHDLPKADKLALQRMDITSISEQPVQSVESLAGYRLKRNIGKGQILTFGAVELIPDIEVGGEVTIVCQEGLLKITVPGEAIQSGSAGDLVKVRNRASGKVLMARVVDDRTVAIQP
jgi:flagella basal body P-ring formation protein FlgA